MCGNGFLRGSRGKKSDAEGLDRRRTLIRCKADFWAGGPVERKRGGGSLAGNGIDGGGDENEN